MVLVPCPKCGEESVFQSKSGPCILDEYNLSDCPSDVLSDVNRHAPNTCEKCGTAFYVEVTTTVKTCPHCGNNTIKRKGISKIYMGQARWRAP